MFGAMWKFDVRFDTKFFAVAYSLLSHTEMFLMTWFTEAIRNLARHMTASKRIQVWFFQILLNCSVLTEKAFFISFRHFFYWKNLKEIDDFYQLLTNIYQMVIIRLME